MRDELAWGALLDPTDTAAAVAASGTIDRVARDEFVPPRAVWRRDRVPALLDEAAARAAAASWRLNGAPRITIEDVQDVRAAVELLRIAPGGPAVHVATAPTKRRRWRLPLRVGYGVPHGLAEAMAQKWWVERLTHTCDVHAGERSLDIWITDSIDRIPSGLDATVILVLGAEQLAVDAVLTAMPRVGASAAILAPGGDPPTAFQHFIEGLSHDLTIDVAAAEIWRDSIVLGDPDFLDHATMRARVTLLGLENEDARDPGDRGLESLGGEPESLLLPGRDPGFWGSESRGASQLLAYERDRDERATAQAAPRHLHALLEQDGVAVTAIAVETPYVLDIWIGERGEGALDAPFPVLQDEPGDHELLVVVDDPIALAQPWSARLMLPPSGETEHLSVELRLPAGAPGLATSVHVLYRGRLLQAAYVEGAVGAAPRVTRVVQQAQLDRLEQRTSADGTLVVDGGRVLAIGHGEVGRIDLPDDAIKQVTAVLDTALSTIEATPAEFGALRSPGNVKLLRGLASKGAKLHAAIVENTKVGERFLEDGPIQVVSRTLGSYLPVELCYRFPAPNPGADLCACAEAALASPEPSPASCQGGDRTRICPLGFLGARRAIERPAHRPEDTDQSSQFVVKYEPPASARPLPRPVKIALAASQNATAKDAEVFRREAVFAQEAPVATWDDWIKLLSERRPDVLVLFPHHAKGDFAAELLEIGKDRLENVDPEHVRGDPPDGRPIVLLLGCETQLARVSYESFAIAFQKAGAAFVVSTIATVLGRTAVPVGARLVEALRAERAQPRVVGGILRDVRRAELAAGRVMVLALTAYGDADCRIA